MRRRRRPAPIIVGPDMVVECGPAVFKPIADLLPADVRGAEAVAEERRVLAGRLEDAIHAIGLAGRAGKLVVSPLWFGNGTLIFEADLVLLRQLVSQAEQCVALTLPKPSRRSL